jgi:hypothetical protein
LVDLERFVKMHAVATGCIVLHTTIQAQLSAAYFLGKSERTARTISGSFGKIAEYFSHNL